MQRLLEEIKIQTNYSELIQENLRLKDENERLTELFQLATFEFKKKNEKIAFLEEELRQRDAVIKELRQENELLKKKVEELEARINLLNKMVFHKRSEKKEAEAIHESGIKKRGGSKKPGHGRKIPENLPVNEEIIDLPEEKKICLICGKPLSEIGLEETSSEIDVQKVYYVKKYKRKVYKKTCSCPNPIVTAPAPPKLIPKGMFSIEFWVDVLINKYKNHSPIERQLCDMKEYGLHLSSGTILGGFKKIHFLYLEPLYAVMNESLRQASHWHADESGWKLFAKVDDKENYNWFIWVFISRDIVLFAIRPNRSAEVPCRILFDMDSDEIKKIGKIFPNTLKKMNVDKFSAYKFMERVGLVELSLCWTHQRREFIDAKIKHPADPDLKNWADEWIRKIGNLYHINNERIKYRLEDPLFIEYDQRLREELSGMESLINIEYTHPAKTAVMSSMKENWKGLTLFVNNPEIPMDNNLSERTIRSAVLGRKNYWGNHSPWSGELTAAMFSIVQTCLMHKVSPRAYLSYYFTECTKRGSAPSKKEIETFLPHRLSEEMKRKLAINQPEVLDDS